MAVSNRAAKLAKLHRVAKKHYQPVSPPSDRSVLEHLLYACLLEDTVFEAADDAFAQLQEGYFDWNEVRVTTAVELAEAISSVSNPNDAAVRLKKTLHSMFETHYTFDIDVLRKENLGKALQKMERYKGITPFVVSYVAQNGLGGHAIGVDNSLINLMYTIGVIDEKEAEKRMVPGLERAIAKNKGVEFFSVVHQLAVAYSSSPFNNDTRAILLSIDPEAKERFPKRTRKKKVAQPTPETSADSAAAKKTAKTKAVGKTAAKTAAKSAATNATEKTAKTKKKVADKSRTAARKTAASKPTPRQKSASAKVSKAAKKKASPKKASARKASQKKAAKTTTRKPARKKKAAATKSSRKASGSRKASASKRLARKKPR